MDDRVRKASTSYTRIIIRRPHAYEFKRKYAKAPIPGVVILDGEGRFVGTHDLQGEDAAKTLAGLLNAP